MPLVVPGLEWEWRTLGSVVKHALTLHHSSLRRPPSTTLCGHNVNTANPYWYDNEVPILKCVIEDAAQIAGSYILLCIWDDDGPIEKPDLCGWAWLKCKEGPFELEINARGRAYGKIMGDLKLEWPDKKGERHRFSQKKDDFHLGCNDCCLVQ